MKITILCSDASHPVSPFLHAWALRWRDLHEVVIVRRVEDLRGGEILFLVSCAQLIDATSRLRYQACLVLHASALPFGRGWSPHVWAILAGQTSLTVTLLEAEEKVDQGRIWSQLEVHVPLDALWQEINEIIFSAEIKLMDFAVEHFSTVSPRLQADGSPASYYRRRTPDDSRIDPMSSIASQFDLLRVCDPNRFPAFFDLHGHRYILKLEKVPH